MSSRSSAIKISPAVGIAGGEVTIDCDHFDTGEPTKCAVWFASERAHVVGLGPHRVLALIPDLKHTGQVEVVLPERLGTWLVVSLLGLPADAALKENQLLDGVGEFANMVCGAWLSKANENASFTLDVPKLTRMPAGWAPEPTPQGDEQAYRTVVVNEMPLEVRAR